MVYNTMVPIAFRRSTRRVSMRNPSSLLPVLVLAGLVAGCRPDAAWSPDSRQLALTPKGQLFTVDVQTRQLRRRLSGPEWTLGPSWSPDGKRIACYRAKLDKQEVKSLALTSFDPATGKLAVLVPKLLVEVPPKPDELQLNIGAQIDLAREALSIAWSPDGSRLVFTGMEGGEPVLWTAQADGSGARPLLPKGKHGYRASWSPDGARIAYVALQAQPSQPAPDAPGSVQPDRDSLEVVAADGSGSHVLWDMSRKEPLAKLGPDPRWSADGKSLLVVSDVLDGEKKNGGGMPERCELWRVPVDGGEPARVASVPGPSLFCTLTGEAGTFFFAPKNPEEQTAQVGLLRPPYSDLKPLVGLTPQSFGQKPNAKMDVDSIPVPLLSPDGKWISVLLAPKEGNATLLLQPAAGGPAQRVTIPFPAAPAAPVRKPAPAKKPRKA